MGRNLSYKVLCYALLTFYVGSVFAQSDTSLKSSEMSGVYIDRSRPFEKGTWYESEGPQTVEEHQYFGSLGWAKGTLFFNGREFQEVDLAYNVYEDLLLVLNLRMEIDRAKALKIDQKKVDGFVINNRKFINYSKLIEPPINSGFYEEYFTGQNLSFYIKHSKEKYLQKEGVDYRPQNTLLLLLRGDYFVIKSKKNLVDLFPEHKKELRLFINENARKFGKRNIEGLSKVLLYCDELGLNES